jgi:pimeloyl-ACP methyl ester carboxylesterase
MAILDALDLEQAHVVGHSTGGCIAITMALAAPTRISSLILSGSWAGPHLYLEALFGWRLKLLETDPKLYEAIGPFLSNTPQWLIDHPQHLSASKALTAQTAPATQPAPWSGKRIRVIKERIGALMAFDRRQELDRLTPPCLVLGARDDVVIPLFLQEELARLIPNATLEVFEQGAHFFPQSQRQAFVDLVRAWLLSNHHG